MVPVAMAAEEAGSRAAVKVDGEVGARWEAVEWGDLAVVAIEDQWESVWAGVRRAG